MPRGPPLEGVVDERRVQQHHLWTVGRVGRPPVGEVAPGGAAAGRAPQPLVDERVGVLRPLDRVALEELDLGPDAGVGRREHEAERHVVVVADAREVVAEDAVGVGEAAGLEDRLGEGDVAPDALGGDWTDAKNEQAAVWLVKSAMKTYAIDPKRVVVTGFSLGGQGTWFLASRHQDVFTAAIPVAAPTAARSSNS